MPGTYPLKISHGGQGAGQITKGIRPVAQALRPATLPENPWFYPIPYATMRRRASSGGYSNDEANHDIDVCRLSGDDRDSPKGSQGQLRRSRPGSPSEDLGRLGTLNPAPQKQFYAQGPHVFFDIAPLKYASWDEYEAGVANIMAEYKAAKFAVNDDLQIHKAGEAYWITSTVAFDMTHKSGKRDLGHFRWTAIFERQDGKWLIIHEHISAPMS